MNWEAVSTAIREVAASEVISRFGTLNASEVDLKAHGEIVTDADHACELALSARLRAIRDIPVVGEEAAAADPELLGLVSSTPAVWVVDPLDGTANFATGSSDYAVMVALVEAGVTVASWMWQPATGVMASAVRSEGAWLGGQPCRARRPVRSGVDASGVLKSKFLPTALQERIARAQASQPGLKGDGRGCAGFDYPDLVTGAVDFLMYWRTLPWDHAPGVLFAQEAGLHAGRPDGFAYEPGDGRCGLIVSHEDIWVSVRDALFDEEVRDLWQ